MSDEDTRDGQDPEDPPPEAAPAPLRVFDFDALGVGVQVVRLERAIDLTEIPGTVDLMIRVFRPWPLDEAGEPIPGAAVPDPESVTVAARVRIDVELRE